MSHPLRSRSTWFVIVSVLGALTIMVLLGAGGGSSVDPLDPDNPNPDGGRALARVLADQGIEVTVARSLDELDRAAGAGDTTVLVTGADALGASTAADLVRRAGRVRVVVAAPGIAASEALGIGVEPYPLPGDEVRAGCEDWGLDRDLRVRVDRARAYDTAQGCFPTRHGHLLGVSESGLLVLGAAELLSNEQVTRADNAATALRLLGQRQRLVWYRPSTADLGGEDAVSLRTLLPAWLQPALLLLGVTAIAAMVWRGRRLGPLEVEPLPVHVRAAETTHSLGRMYHRAADRAHAARVLRAAARTRLAEQLRLPSSVPADHLVRDVAARLGRTPAEVTRLLGPDAPDPQTDTDLARLAADLADITREATPR